MQLLAARDAGFEAALAASPDDAGLRLIYADWLDDHGETAYAAAHRWLAANGKWPDHHPRLFRLGVWLFGHPDNGTHEPRYRSCRLPVPLHAALARAVEGPDFDPTDIYACSVSDGPSREGAVAGGRPFFFSLWMAFATHRQAVEYLARALETVGEPE